MRDKRSVNLTQIWQKQRHSLVFPWNFQMEADHLRILVVVNLLHVDM